jgi:hypothetical protein
MIHDFAKGFNLIMELDKLIERWKVIKDYDNYSVSTFGRVRNDQTGNMLKLNKDRAGYLRIGLYKNDTQVYFFVHRLVGITFVDNSKNKQLIDHIDNNTTNNYFKNLRFVTNSENQMNKTKQSNNTSGITGVYFEKSNNKWRAQIYLNSKRKHLGCFETIEQAKEARIKAVNKYFGEYAHSSQKL